MVVDFNLEQCVTEDYVVWLQHRFEVLAVPSNLIYCTHIGEVV